MTHIPMPARINLSPDADGPVANGHAFDGNALARSVSFIGTNSNGLLVSFFFNNGSNPDATNLRVLYGNGGAVAVYRSTDSKFTVFCKDTASAFITTMQSTSLYNSTTNLGWHHCVAWVNNTVGETVGKMYIDGALEATGTIATNVEIDHSVSYGYGGLDLTGTGEWAGSISNLIYYDSYTALQGVFNMDADDVHLLFRNSDGTVRSYPNETNYPYGDNGERPLGSVPLLYFPKAYGSWNENVGSGGGFTEDTAGVTDGGAPS